MEIDEAIAALRLDPAFTGIFLDFDGTLSAMVLDPSAAEMVPGAGDVLSGLAGRYALVALISGRGALDLRQRAGVQGLRYFGLYGAQELTERGLEQPAAATRWRQDARRLAAAAARIIEEQSLIGCEVEYKDLAVAIHYRKANSAGPPPGLYRWAQQAAAEAEFSVGIGRKVIELRPGPVSKASTFERLAVQAGIRNALVAGDDAADVEMMGRAKLVLGGAVLRVGIRSAEAPQGLEQQADVQVGSPEEFVALLSRLV